MNIKVKPVINPVQLVELLGKGTFHVFVYHKQITDMPKKYASYGVLESVSEIAGRLGVDYDNIQAVKEGRENGTLQIGHLNGMKTIVEDVVYESLKTGKTILRVTPFKGGKHSKKWFLNGVETSVEDLLKIYPAYILGLNKKGNPPLVLSLEWDGIVEVR